MLTVNNHPYFIFDRIIGQKEKWVGGVLFDHGNYLDDNRRGDFNFSLPPRTGKLKDIQLLPSGKELARLLIDAVGDDGADFKIEEEVSVLSIDATSKPGTLLFAGFGGHKFELTPKPGETFSFRLFED